MNVRRIFGLDQREKGRAYLIFFIYINWHSSLQMFFFICCKSSDNSHQIGTLVMGPAVGRESDRA